ncbi:RHS repeat-associated core domain-containing protein [Roseivirga sp.]|uniref:RHS repeat-associated core domain-containing protein n=1 Tax=Roseivirga sp. TaxID=1964215 RepID=UPI003B52F78E
MPERDSNKPRAYLNYILFDRDFVYITAGFSQVSNAADQFSLTSLSKNIDKAGFIYVYVSNESNNNAPVYFDDLRITHTKGEIIQEDHYYPFGMNIQALSSNAPLSKVNQFKYNEGSEFHSGFGLKSYETLFRVLDPVLGRWWQVDPASELMFDQSPYSSMDNNPIRFNDPLGDCPTCPQGEEADEIYAVGALVTNNQGSWQYLGGGKWKDVSSNPSTASNNNTNYYYDRSDFEMRSILLDLGSGNPVTRELERRESAGQYLPITANNYLNTVDERSARLGIFALYSTGSLYLGGAGRMPSTRGVTISARYSGSSTGVKLTGVYDVQATHGITMSNRQFAKLKADIKQNGIREPIKYTTYNGRRYVVDGHHRLRAARELGMESIPAEEVTGYRTPMDLVYTHY